MASLSPPPPWASRTIRSSLHPTPPGREKSVLHSSNRKLERKVKELTIQIDDERQHVNDQKDQVGGGHAATSGRGLVALLSQHRVVVAPHPGVCGDQWPHPHS